MSLKELTADKHAEAENTKFMRAVFANKMTREVWKDFTYQKTLFYNAIESCLADSGLLQQFPDLRRTFKLHADYLEMTGGPTVNSYSPSTIAYYQYIMNLYPDVHRVMAHLYTWHMGDLHGGQMIKRVIDAPHSSLDFEDRAALIKAFREHLTDDMAEESKIAFDWAICIMKEYDSRLE